MTNFYTQIILALIKREGGFVNHPDDHGGATKYGITQKTLASWRGSTATVKDVQELTKATATSIYWAEYLHKTHIESLPALIIPMVFDMAVNMGSFRAIGLLQSTVNQLSLNFLAVDGILGPKTLATIRALAAHHEVELVPLLVRCRMQFYRDLAAKDPSQQIFLAGWLKRAESFLV